MLLLILFFFLGMIPISSSMDILDTDDSYKYPVLLDGKLIGHIPSNIVIKVRDKLRIYKIEGVDIPHTLEIVVVPKKIVWYFFIILSKFFNTTSFKN